MDLPLAAGPVQFGSTYRASRHPNKKAAQWAASSLSGEERGIVGCIPAPDPDARCAPGPACGCPVLLLQNRRTPAGRLTTHPIRQTNAKGPPCGRPFCVCLAERGAASAMIHSVSRRINNPWSPAFPTLSLHLVASLNSMSLHHLMLGQMWGQGCQRRSLSHSLPSRFLS